MSEREFETYLTLLCRLLRLDSEQREVIARELRDHLEERLAELKARGVDREEAVRLALEEFGDAAGLAAEFSLIARNVRRRWLVRATLSSVLAAAALVLAAMAMWPDANPGPATAVAQQAADPAAPAEIADAAADESRASEDVLSRRVDAEFIETPLADVLDYLADSVGGQFYVNRNRLADVEISLDAPVTLNLKQVRVDMLLDLALAQVSHNLAYVVRDEIVIVSTLDDLEGAAEVRVYNVRDLVKLRASADPAAMMPGGEMYGSEGLGDYGEYGGMGMPGGMIHHSEEHQAQLLTQVIKAAVGQKHWQENGDYGTIAAYDGLIVVNHNTRVHQQVERLLEMMRAATGEETQDQGAQP